MVEAADGGLWGAAGATSRIDHRQGRRRKDTRILVEVTLTHTEVGGSGVAAEVCGGWGEGGLEETNKVGRNSSFARHSLPHDTTHAFPWPSRALVRSDNPSPAAHC